jgi:SAM-dependent methyltransferase
MGQQSTLYSSEFYRTHVDGSADSAAIVVPLVLSFLRVNSVIDVGCGVGPWAAAFRANGVPEVLGVDGDYVDRSLLRIPSDLFVARDLTKPLGFDRTFDLAVCLEVAEHLPESRAVSLVADLTALAPCVLFSAAVPGVGGTNHINEQFLPYWVALFQTHGYEGIDPIRPLILGNPAVEWWYQQNIVMFAAPSHPLLAKGFRKPQTIIHEYLYDLTRNHQPPLRTLLRAFPATVYRAIRRRLAPSPRG